MSYRKKAKRGYAVQKPRSLKPFKHIRIEEYSSVEAIWKIENPAPEIVERIRKIQLRGFPVRRTGRTFFIGPVYSIRAIMEVRKLLSPEEKEEKILGY